MNQFLCVTFLTTLEEEALILDKEVRIGPDCATNRKSLRRTSDAKVTVGSDGQQRHCQRYQLRVVQLGNRGSREIENPSPFLSPRGLQPLTFKECIDMTYCRHQTSIQTLFIMLRGNQYDPPSFLRIGSRSNLSKHVLRIYLSPVRYCCCFQVRLMSGINISIQRTSYEANEVVEAVVSKPGE